MKPLSIGDVREALFDAVAAEGEDEVRVDMKPVRVRSAPAVRLPPPTAFAGDDERVFANPRTGRPFDATRYSTILRLALDRVGIEERIRPSHDLRHSSITNAAAAGTSPAALMARAGHSSMSTTLRYIDLAGESFRDEADLLERRLWGGPVESSGRKFAPVASEGEAA